MPADTEDSRNQLRLAEVCEELSRQLERTVSWLTSMPLNRLDRGDPGPSIAARANEMANRLVRIQLVLEPASYPLHAADELLVPRVKSHAAGSQLAVVGNELLAATSRIEESYQREAADHEPSDEAPVPEPELSALLSAVSGDLIALRSS